MAFSRQVEERRQRREAGRRARELERRQQADREQQEEERRRDEAATEARARDLELDAERERRLAIVLQARAARLGERRELAQRTEQRRKLLDMILQARRQAADAAEARRARVEERQSPPREADEDQPDRPERDAGSDDATAARREARVAERRERNAARADPDDQASATESQASARRREEQRAQAEREARDAERREARQRARDEAAAAAGREQLRRAEARDARMAERREQDEALEAVRSAREAAQRARLDQRQQREAADEVRRERALAARALRLEARPERAAEDRVPRPGRDESQREERPRSSPPEPSSSPDPLTDRIPSGVLSSSLPWLTTKGNRVITITGEPVILRGVSLLGMDGAGPDPAQGYAAGAGITDALLDPAIEWGANVVRVAINRRRVLAGTDRWTGWDYLQEIDELVRRNAQSRAYTLLSLRRLDDNTIFGTQSDGGRRVPNQIAPQPDFDAIGMWRLVAERYADEPAVLFDLYTAPRAPASDDLTGYRTDWDLWTLWVQMTVADVRQVHPRALCLVAGLDDGTDLSRLPIPGSAGDPIPNLVYAAHLTPRRSSHWPAIRALARRHPVFVTEWGGSDGDVTWGERTALALRAEGLGWTAAHWNAEPTLVNAVRDRLVPTRFGVVVQRALTLA